MILTRIASDCGQPIHGARLDAGQEMDVPHMKYNKEQKDHIRSRKHGSHCAHGSVLPVATLATGLMLALPASVYANEVAEAAAADNAGNDAVTLNEVTVEANNPYLVDAASSPKFVRPLQDTPQTIQVISRDLFNQQGATNLTEALRNSAGVGTFYAGENGNTSTGDAIYMRGFDSSNSLYVDGVRDVGSVSRDVFNIEQIEVVKGPAGTDNGRSAPTGAINLVSKQARLHDTVAGTVAAGTDGQMRVTSDWNQMLGESSAFRINALWQDSDVPGRDHVNNSRWGLAPSLGFGINTDTRVFLNLLYVKQSNVPDGFVPTIGLNGWAPQPGLEHLVGHPVDSTNFYGTQLDHDDVEAKMATLKFEHDFSDTVAVTNTARWGTTTQDYLLTSFMSTGNNIHRPPGSDPSDLSAYTMARTIPTIKDQRNTIVTDQLNLRANFATGTIGHELSAGFEIAREKQGALNFRREGGLPDSNLYRPDWNDVGSLSWAPDGTSRNGRTDTAALYAFDTLAFGERVLVTAGVRADRYETRYHANAICNTPGTSGGSGRGIVYCGDLPLGNAVETADLKAKDTLFNWKLGTVYKVNPDFSLYANMALSQQPPGGSNFELSAAPNSANNPNLDPQKAKTLEVGTKWTVPGEWLFLNAALFRTDVTNEINTQVLDDAGNPTQTGEKQVKGIELSAVGNLTHNWSISAAYSHLDTDVTEGAPITSDGTPNLTYTPGDSFSAWSTWRLSSGTTIGGGARYMGGLHRGRDGAVGTPAVTGSYTVFDAVVSQVVNKHLVLRLNAYNITDEDYVASINKSGYRYVPGPARTFMLSADFHF